MFVGMISYGLYLWHPAFLLWLEQHTFLGGIDHWRLSAGWPLLFLCVLPGGIILGTLSYYVVELPFLKVKRRVGSRRRSRPDESRQAMSEAS